MSHRWTEWLKNLLVVSFEKVCGLCVMKKTTYVDKLNEMLIENQLESSRSSKSHDLTRKWKKLINSSLPQIMKEGKIREKISEAQ